MRRRNDETEEDDGRLRNGHIGSEESMCPFFGLRAMGALRLLRFQAPPRHSKIPPYAAVLLLPQLIALNEKM